MYKDQAFTLEADMDIVSDTGVAAGITFGVKDKNNVTASWFCANIERTANGDLAKLFKNENGEKWAVSKLVPSTKRAAPYHLKLVYDGAGKLTYYVNDLEIGSRDHADLPAEGFVGIQTFKSDTVFNNVTIAYTDAKPVKAEETLAPISVAYKEADVDKKLPQRVNIRYDNGAVLAQPITWNTRSVDTSKPGVYLVEGTADGLAVQITVTVQTNKAELMKAVEAAKNYKENDYTADSWKQFTAALKEAQAILAEAEATQSEIDNAVEKLDIAVKQLQKNIKKADQTELENVLKQAKSIKADGYTAESYKRLTAAVKAAEKIMADENALQSDVDNAVKAVNTAVASLEAVKETVNKKQLEDLVKILKTVKKESYTAASWTAFEKALQQAEAVLKDEHVSAADVTKAYEALQKAYRALSPMKLEEDKKQEDEKKESGKPDATNPDTGDTTSAAAAGMLTLLAGGAAVVIRRRKKSGKA